MPSALPFCCSQPTRASTSDASFGLTLNVHLLPPTPVASAIAVTEPLATMQGSTQGVPQVGAMQRCASD